MTEAPDKSISLYVYTFRLSVLIAAQRGVWARSITATRCDFSIRCEEMVFALREHPIRQLHTPSPGVWRKNRRKLAFQVTVGLEMI